MTGPFWLHDGSGDEPHQVPDGIRDADFITLMHRHAVMGVDAWLAKGFVCRDGSRLTTAGLTSLDQPALAPVTMKMRSMRIAQLLSLTPDSLEPWGEMAEQLRVLEFPEGVVLDSHFIRSLSRFPVLEAIAFDGLDMQAAAVQQLITQLTSIRRLRELALPRCLLDTHEISFLIDTCGLSRLVVSSQLVSDTDQRALCARYDFCDIRWE